MSENDPLYMRILEKLGFNTTRLRWKLYEKEKKLKEIAKHGVKPARFEWFSYPHKLCTKCRAVNDKEATICHACDAKLPSMFGYKMRRLITGSASDDSPIVSQIFLGLILLFYAIQINAGGFSLGNIMGPDRIGTHDLGSFSPIVYNGFSEWYRWLAFALLHGSLIHIAFNIYALFNLCPLVENQIGRGRTLTLITLSQLGAAFACFLVYYEIRGASYPVVGASGWIFGLMGYAIVHFHFYGDLTHHLRNSLMKWCGFSLVLGFFIPIISNTGHIGGLIVGGLIALLPEGGNMRKLWIDKTWNIAGALCALIWITAAAWMLYMFFNGTNEYILEDPYAFEEVDSGYYE